MSEGTREDYQKASGHKSESGMDRTEAGTYTSDGAEYSVIKCVIERMLGTNDTCRSEV